MDRQSSRKHRVLYISHGAGPLPVLGDERHAEMVANLKHLAATMEKPSAVLVISAHWEEPRPTITSGAHPPLLFDYYGFPQESYELRYPAPGHPELEEHVHGALSERGFACGQDNERGFDHGVFIPLMLMYPDADIPCVQLSLIKGLAPAEHISMGEALSTLPMENLLIMGSGFSFHNMQAFFTPDTETTRGWNEAFDSWLVETCSSAVATQKERVERLIHWESAPHARYCHPREEHLLPLHVCCGAAGGPCSESFALTIFDKKASAFLW